MTPKIGMGRKNRPMKSEGKLSPPDGVGIEAKIALRKANSMKKMSMTNSALRSESPITCTQMMSQRALPISCPKVAEPGYLRMRQYWRVNCLMAPQRETGAALPAWLAPQANAALEIGGGIPGPGAGTSGPHLL